MRENYDYRKPEAVSDKVNKKTKRQNDIYMYRENFVKQLHTCNSQQSIEQIEFLNAIKDGPTHVCCCCEGLFFLHSIVRLDVEKIKNKTEDIK